MGSVRHVADIRADDMDQDGQGHVTLQAGTNKFASQKGMSMGAVRHAADIRADDMDQEGCGVIGLQSGTTTVSGRNIHNCTIYNNYINDLCNSLIYIAEYIGALGRFEFFYLNYYGIDFRYE